MIYFHTETVFKLPKEESYALWISGAIKTMKKELGDINFIFCDDAYLLELNIKYLKHDTLTDIISFDYSSGSVLSGDIFISVDRVKENAKKFGVDFTKELQRVLIHGILHFAGFNDKTEEEKAIMRQEENKYINLLTI